MYLLQEKFLKLISQCYNIEIFKIIKNDVAY